MYDVLQALHLIDSSVLLSALPQLENNLQVRLRAGYIGGVAQGGACTAYDWFIIIIAIQLYTCNEMVQILKYDIDY